MRIKSRDRHYFFPRFPFLKNSVCPYFLDFKSYWGAFITLGCNFTCPFCIQKVSGPVPSYKMASGDKWVKALNSIEGRVKKRFLRRDKVKKLALIGGEPTLHPDFFEIVNGLDGNWSLTVTTNLGTKAFDDIGSFAGKIKRRKKLRFHPSFHDAHISAREFIAKAKDLKNSGIKVNRIFTVCYPPDDFSRFQGYAREFRKNGLFLEKQRFGGYYKGTLYPAGGDESSYEFKDNIRDYKEYARGCSAKERKKIHCRMNKVLFAPDGRIYNCHYKVYSRSGDFYGNLFSANGKIDIPQGYFPCNDYGFCNPCDWPYAQFR